MLISNPYAGSVSDRARQVIVKALSADCKLDAIVTSHRDHAIELATSAVEDGFDAVVAFGGDGTINEIAQGLVGTETALGVLPGGSTNVMARSLGIPVDPIEATAVIGSRLRSGSVHRVNVGKLLDRYFIFSAGMGLDAEVVRQYEAHPEWKNKNYEWSYIRSALKAGSGEYRKSEPRITLEVPGHAPVRVVLAITANGRPFTYFRRWPVDVLPQATLDGGLDVFGLDRIRITTIPRIIFSLFVSRSHVRWKTGHHHHDIESLRLVPDEPMPVQVDGDYVGQFGAVDITLERDTLKLLI